jgi:thioredoxin-like negative regulator of GroEL
MSKRVIVFKATWCGPCKAYAPIIEKAKPAIEAKGYELHIVDIDDNYEMARDYGVRGVPFTVIEIADSVPVMMSGIQQEDVLISKL